MHDWYEDLILAKVQFLCFAVVIFFFALSVLAIKL